MKNNTKKWFWFRTFGALLATAPGVIYTTMVFAASDDFETIAPFVQYMVVACAAILSGYLLMRKGMREEERERIRSIVQEVLQEQARPVLSEPPVGLSVIEGGKGGVSSLPFMEKEQR